MGEGVSDREPVVPYLLAVGCEHPVDPTSGLRPRHHIRIRSRARKQ